MKCLIIDVVHEAIAQELGKYMEVKVSEKLPPAKDELKAMIGDVDVLIMRVDPMIDKDERPMQQIFQSAFSIASIFSLSTFCTGPSFAASK